MASNSDASSFVAQTPFGELTGDDNMDHYRYVGGPRGYHAKYWQMVIDGQPASLHVLADNECVCGEQLPESDMRIRYVRHDPTNTVLTVGPCCFQSLPENRRCRTCATCDGPHKSRFTNQCLSCLPANQRPYPRASDRSTETSETLTSSTQTTDFDPFEHVYVNTDFLSFLNRSVLPRTPMRMSWSITRLVPRADGPQHIAYVSCFIDCVNVFVLDFNLVHRAICRIRIKPSGRLVVAEHLHANLDRITDTLNLLLPIEHFVAEAERD